MLNKIYLMLIVLDMDLNQKIIGKHFIMNGHDYILVGFNISARKNFCILERDGKEFVCAPEMLMRNFKGE